MQNGNGDEVKWNKIPYRKWNSSNIQLYNSSNKQTNKCMMMQKHSLNPIAMVQLICFLTLDFIEVCLAHIQPAINYYPSERAIHKFYSRYHSQCFLCLIAMSFVLPVSIEIVAHKFS